MTNNKIYKPTREQAEEAVKTLILWAGDDPGREGLIDTPKRVVKSYEEFFKGYNKNPEEILKITFEDTENYDEMILLKDIRLESYCEHHMVPIIGIAHIAYIPDGKVVGISKIARLVEIFSKRLQIQEKLTKQISDTINKFLKPKGVAVVIEANHQCISTRGIHKPGVTMLTSSMQGIFRENSKTRQEFLTLITSKK